MYKVKEAIKNEIKFKYDKIKTTLVIKLNCQNRH